MTGVCSMSALTILLAYELETGLQYSDGTTASRTNTTRTLSAQDPLSTNIPSATPSISDSTAPTERVFNTSLCNASTDTSSE